MNIDRLVAVLMSVNSVVALFVNSATDTLTHYMQALLAIADILDATIIKIIHFAAAIAIAVDFFKR